MLRFHAQTAGSTLTGQQPDVNIVRTAIEALAAVLGGAQSLHTNAKDEALGLPTEEAALLALRTQQIIAHESGVVNTVDPVGGSYFIERLTTEIKTRAEELLDRVAAQGGPQGGMLRAIETGLVQREIQESAFQAQRAVENGERVIVGVNRFQLPEEAPYPPLRVDPALEAEQVARLRQLRAERHAARAQAALARVEETARDGGNLLPPVLAAVESLATVGEISDALRRVFGEYREAVVV
jgi:methylmalonyl-CoA mutase N-terminal domain/subunit